MASHKAKSIEGAQQSLHRGDYLGVVAFHTPPDQAARLEKLVPDKKQRLLVRHMRLGMVGDTRVKMARKHRQSNLSDLCPHCKGTKQTAPHVLLDCPIGAEMRDHIRDVYTSHAATSDDLPFAAMLNHVLSNDSPIPKAHDKALRRDVLPMLRIHSERIAEQLQAENVTRPMGSHECNYEL